MAKKRKSHRRATRPNGHGAKDAETLALVNALLVQSPVGGSWVSHDACC